MLLLIHRPGQSSTSRGWLVLPLVALLLTLAARARAEEARFAIDLHAHVFMKPGLGWLFRGSFDQRTATRFDQRLHARIDAESLDQSKLDLVVVALFAHPAFCIDVRACVWEQIERARRFVARHPDWAIATDPAQAMRLHQQGKRLLVLSLEGAASVLESERDLERFIDEGGIRIVTLLHLTDDRYGGAATMAGFQYVANPLGVADRLLDPAAPSLDRNHRGLTPLGRVLAAKLIERGVWLDLTHASDRALATLQPWLDRSGQPPLFTHVSLRRDRPMERALSESALAFVAARDGVIGLLPSDDAFETERKPAPPCPPGCGPEQCRRGVSPLLRAYRELQQAGVRAVHIGSDFNGGMRHLGASCGVTGALALPSGFFHPGQFPDLARAFGQLGLTRPPAEISFRRFVERWERVQPTPLDAGELPADENTRGPSIAFGVEVGLGTV
ncbi:MAG: membrane dipeptidase, partial [Myxococcota bacterium]